jgi:regulatory protein RepA
MALDTMRPLNLISFGQILTGPFLPVDWDIEPLISHASRVVVAGAYSSLKSWILPHMALSLAAGVPWLRKYPIPQARRTLYIDEEMNEPSLRRRMRRLAKGLGLDAPDLPFWTLSRAGVRFDGRTATNLLDLLGQSRFVPEVVIVETLRRVIVGSENDAKDVGEFWRAVDPIVQAGITLIISHHMRKPSRMGRDMMRDRVSGGTDICCAASGNAHFSTGRESHRPGVSGGGLRADSASRRR